MKTILITGATAGIGTALAHTFVKAGHRVIITGRRIERLADLQAELAPNCHALCFDLQDKDAVEAAIAQLPIDWKDIDILINNAGLALGRSPIQTGKLSDWDIMIDTNLKGLLYLSRQIMPLMIARKQGHIINLGSIAGKQVYPGGNIYCATKHAVRAISQAMRLDLLPHRIKVTDVQPGMVETEFSVVRFKGDQQAADKVYQGFQPLIAQDIADIVYYLSDLPPHVNINEIEITCLAQANAYQTIKS